MVGIRTNQITRDKKKEKKKKKKKKKKKREIYIRKVVFAFSPTFGPLQLEP